MEKQISIAEGSAFEFLQKLPPLKHKGDRSLEITANIALSFTNTFRNKCDPFMIPISWVMTKEALINLLGITSYEHYPEVTGIRLYASINDGNQLTLVAVSTKAGMGCDDDLTEEDNYAYYDYADACPVNCSNTGNLKAIGSEQVAAYFTRCAQQ